MAEEAGTRRLRLRLPRPRPCTRRSKVRQACDAVGRASGGAASACGGGWAPSLSSRYCSRTPRTPSRCRRRRSHRTRRRRGCRCSRDARPAAGAPRKAHVSGDRLLALVVIGSDLRQQLARPGVAYLLSTLSRHLSQAAAGGGRAGQPGPGHLHDVLHVVDADRVASSAPAHRAQPLVIAQTVIRASGPRLPLTCISAVFVLGCGG
jgi:hypothetical protein